MSFKAFCEVLDWSRNDLYGWSGTWDSFCQGRWFSIVTQKWPNAFDDESFCYKVHPRTLEKLVRDGLVEILEPDHWLSYKNRHVKLRLTQKGQEIVEKEVTHG